MKTLVTVLVAALVLLGVLVIFVKQDSEKQLTKARHDLDDAHKQLQAAQVELSTVRTQMTARLSVLQQTVDKLSDEKAEAEEKLATIGGEMTTLMTEVQEQKTRADGLAETSRAMSNQLQQVATELGNVKSAYASLEQAHTDTLGHLSALRQDYVEVNQEKTALEAKFNDLTSLRLQIATVKRQMHEEQIADRERLDRAATLSGNNGFLLRQGEWQTTLTETRKFPLSEEIRRPE